MTIIETLKDISDIVDIELSTNNQKLFIGSLGQYNSTSLNKKEVKQLIDELTELYNQMNES
jgi:hypothetical protein